MTDVELLSEWIGDIARDTRELVGSLPLDAIMWSPDPEANSIGVTVWHMSRWLDLLAVRAFQNQPPEEEQWFTRGWAEKTGYDPRGHGYRGYGTVTGYTLQEVREIPVLSAEEQLAYLDQVCGALTERVAQLTSEQLHQPAPGLGGKRSYYSWLKPIVQGCFGHLGEIAALVALRRRWSLQAEPPSTELQVREG